MDKYYLVNLAEPGSSILMQATPPNVNHEKVSHALLEIKVVYC